MLDYHVHVAFHHESHGLGDGDYLALAIFEAFQAHMRRALGRTYCFQSLQRRTVLKVDCELELCRTAADIKNARRFMTLQFAIMAVRQIAVRYQPYRCTDRFLRHL